MAAGFSILFSGERATPRPGSADDPRDVCLAVMQELVSAMPEGRELESTCRATAIHGETVVETLFAQVGGQVRGIGKVRPAVPGDAAWNVNSPTGGLWKRVGLAGLFLLAICFFAWQTGLVDRAFSASAADLAFSTNGDLSGLVRFETTQSAGNYVVTATPAAGWPATVAEADAVRAAAATPLDRAMIDAVLAGRTLDVELQNEAGESLARAPLSCAPLLQGPSEPGKPVGDQNPAPRPHRSEVDPRRPAERLLTR